MHVLGSGILRNKSQVSPNEQKTTSKFVDFVAKLSSSNVKDEVVRAYFSKNVRTSADANKAWAKNYNSNTTSDLYRNEASQGKSAKRVNISTNSTDQVAYYNKNNAPAQDRLGGDFVTYNSFSNGVSPDQTHIIMSFEGFSPSSANDLASSLPTSTISDPDWQLSAEDLGSDASEINVQDNGDEVFDA